MRLKRLLRSWSIWIDKARQRSDLLKAMYGVVKGPSCFHLFEVRAEWSQGVEGSLEGQSMLLSSNFLGPGERVVG